MGKNCFTFIVLVIMVPALFISCGTLSPSQSKHKQALELKKQGNVETYKQTIKEARDMDPNNVFVLNDMANISWAEKKIPEARAYYMECIEKGKDVMIGVSEVQEFVGKPMSEICKFNLDRLEKYAQAQDKIKRQLAAQIAIKKEPVPEQVVAQPDIKKEPPPKQQIEEKPVVEKPVVMDKPKDKGASIKVTAPTATLRSEPSLTSSQVGHATKGTLLSILNESKDERGVIWYKIKTPVSKKEAWISGRLVVPAKQDISNLENEKYAQAQEKKIKRQSAAAKPDIKKDLPSKQQIEEKPVAVDKPKDKKDTSIEVTVPAANLRSEPSLTSSQVGYVTKGTLLLILNESKDGRGVIWYRVKTPVSKKEAWVSEKAFIPVK